MVVHRLSLGRFLHTTFWAFVVSALIVGAAAVLARATINLKAALTDKPDIAIYLLLPEEEIGYSTLLREEENVRHYYAETKEGPKVIRLKKVNGVWEVKEVEKMRE